MNCNKTFFRISKHELEFFVDGEENSLKVCYKNCCLNSWNGNYGLNNISTLCM